MKKTISLFLFIAMWISSNNLHSQELITGITATQSNNFNSSLLASRVLDGNPNTISHTTNGPLEWLKLDLGASYTIDRLVIYNRQTCCAGRLSGTRIGVSFIDSDNPSDYEDIGVSLNADLIQEINAISRTGRYLLLHKSGFLHIGEIEVYGTSDSGTDTSEIGRFSRGVDASGYVIDRYQDDPSNTLSSVITGLNSDNLGTGEFFIGNYDENVTGEAYTKWLSFDIASDELSLNQLGQGNFTGTPTQILAVEADGKVVEVDPGTIAGSLSEDDTNRILNASKDRLSIELATSANLSGLSTSVQSGTEIGRKIIYKVSSATESTIVVDDTGAVDDVWVFRTDNGTSTINLVEGNGITINSTLGEDIEGISIVGLDHYIYLRKDGPNTYFASSDAPMAYEAPVPANLYTEASAVNPDNQAAIFGSWKRASNKNPTNGMTVTTETPSGSAIGTSLRLMGNFLTEFARMELDLSATGTSLVVGQSYTISFDYRRVDGDTTGDGLTVRVKGTENQDFIISNAVSTNWVNTSVTFMADSVQPIIWLAPSWEAASTNSDFYFTNFEITE